MKQARKIRRTMMIGLCALGFVGVAREGNCANYNARVPNNGTYIQDVIEVSPSLASPYNQISSAIAQIPTSGSGVPSQNSPVLIRVYPGTYAGGFTIPAYVTVRGVGSTRALIQGVTTMTANTTGMLPIVDMPFTFSTLEDVAIGWTNGISPSPSGSNNQLVNVGISNLFANSLLAVDSNAPSSLVGVTLNVFGLVDRVLLFSGSPGTCIAAAGGQIRDSQFLGCSNVGLSAAAGGLFCWTVNVINSQISGTNYSIAWSGTCGFGGGGNTTVDVAVSQLGGSFTGPGTGNPKIVHCYDNNYNPITNQ